MIKLKSQSDDQGATLLPDWEPGWLTVLGARHNNLKSIDVSFPLSAFTAVTGVSGSGKSSLVEDVLYKTLARRLNRSQDQPGACDSVLGIDRINKVIQVDQRPIGQTPTSNPATYTGLFDLIRQLFAELPESRLRGYTPRRFSFNAPGGRCEKCQGAGQLNIEMHFLADVWITCDECGGRRYDKQTLEVKFRGKSIADVLEMSCKDALKLFANVPKIARILRMLCDVGLDYISLGQSSTTLSGGEAQRVKLANELARPDTGRTLYVLDEPTTGLHFNDLAKLLEVLHRLVDLGNTVIIIEHNLDIIKSVDWVIDIGPEAGLEGGRLVFAGTPEQLADYSRKRKKLSKKKRELLLPSYTGEALIPILENGHYAKRPLFDAAAYAQELRQIKDEELLPELELGGEDTKMPWESDGRKWHTQDRISRIGTPCRWDGRILAEVIDRIEESDFFAPVDWNNRTIVEVRAEKKSIGWFLHAITGEEWLLKLRFRTSRNTFKKELLIDQLNLRPLNEMDDIPLYGTQPRTKVETTGLWQEIELKVCHYSEIDRPEFREFLDLAIARFGELVIKTRQSEIDVAPWRTLGEKWHLTPGNCYGGSSRPRWNMALLKKIFAMIARRWPHLKPLWTNKVLVPFSSGKGTRRTCLQVYTKNCEFVCLQLNVDKNEVPLGRVAELGFDPEVDGGDPDFDCVYLRFRDESELNESQLEKLFSEIEY